MTERSIFDAALDIADPADRAAYLDRACAGDPALRDHVESLIGAQSQLGSFLACPVLVASGAVPPAAPAEELGTTIGPYRLLEKIGEGGMGVVYLAEQAHPVRRKVALKIIKPGMDTAQVVARFEAERQALALMDHPNIARVLDAGSTGERGVLTPRLDRGDDSPRSPAGRPYFVMELVRGLPITDYCDQARLSVRDRLALFATVCRAVQHAHQKGVIHRDLKPSNVLVTVIDGAPVPKVIDFGVAKATGGALTDRTLCTGFHQMVGTPLYMSPEQAELSGVDVDTRTDVYALGVLLYELLTGHTPFDAATLRRAAFDEVRRIIREDDPPTPSRRLCTLEGRAQSTVSERRGVDGRRLGRLLRGELDWVVMRALEKDRNRRYESAGALAADLERYLNDESVEACPPTAWYRVRKMTRRNRRMLATAAVVAVTLVAATAVSTWLAVKATNAERRAADEAAIARAVNDFLQGDLLRQVNTAPQASEESPGEPNLTVREALHRAAAKIEQRFQDRPLVEAAIRMAIGNAYRSVDEPGFAVPHLERAVQLRKAHLGPDHPDTHDAMYSLAMPCEWVDRIPDALALYHEILKYRKSAFGPDHAETLACLNSIGIAHRKAGKWDVSVPLLEQVVEKRRATLGPTHPHALDTMATLALNYGDVGRVAESLALHDRVLDIRRSILGPEDEGTIASMSAAAYTRQQAGQLEQADPLFREVLVHRRKRKDSAGRVATANVLCHLGLNLVLQQQCTAAEPLLSEALAIYDKEKPDDWMHFHVMSVLGGAFLGQQKYAAAEPLLLQAYESLKQRGWIMIAPVRYRITQAGERIVRFYQETRQPEKAREWSKTVEAARPADRGY